MNKLLERYRRLSPGERKFALVGIAAGILFDVLIIRHIIKSDSTKLLPKPGWIAVTLLSTPGGGLSYLRFGRR